MPPPLTLPIRFTYTFCGQRGAYGTQIASLQDKPVGQALARRVFLLSTGANLCEPRGRSSSGMRSFMLFFNEFEHVLKMPA